MTNAPQSLDAGIVRAVQRNWAGLLSIGLSVAGVALYMPAPMLFALGTVASLLVGIMAIVRARRGAGGLITGIVGVVMGGALTLLWTAWIVGLMLNPGALG